MILKLIQSECNLDKELWDHQSRFFRDLIQATFQENDDSPGWIIVAGPRRSFMDRRETNSANTKLRGAPHEVIEYPRKLYNAGESKYKLTLQSTRFHNNGLLIRGPAAASVKDSALCTMLIRRRMFLRDLARTLPSDERWTFIASPDDQNELRNGYNPAVEQFRIKESRIQTAPMISLARYCRKMHLIYSLNFSLTPGEGHVIDFREIEQPFDFAIRNDLINTSIMRDSTRVSTSDPL